LGDERLIALGTPAVKPALTAMGECAQGQPERFALQK
jgi:hypothetical protein